MPRPLLQAPSTRDFLRDLIYNISWHSSRYVCSPAALTVSHGLRERRLSPEEGVLFYREQTINKHQQNNGGLREGSGSQGGKKVAFSPDFTPKEEEKVHVRRASKRRPGEERYNTQRQAPPTHWKVFQHPGKPCTLFCQGESRACNMQPQVSRGLIENINRAHTHHPCDGS